MEWMIALKKAGLEPGAVILVYFLSAQVKEELFTVCF